MVIGANNSPFRILGQWRCLVDLGVIGLTFSRIENQVIFIILVIFLLKSAVNFGSLTQSYTPLLLQTKIFVSRVRVTSTLH